MTTKEFNKLPKNEKAVLVAKDILKQIKKGKYLAEIGGYISAYFTDDKIKINDQIQKQFKEIDHCKVCQIGASLMSYIRLGNELTFKDLEIHDKRISIEELNNKKVKKALLSIFTKRTIAMMEVCFEQVYDKECTNAARDLFNYKLAAEDIDECINYTKNINTGKDKMIKICKNIIKNNGELVI